MLARSLAAALFVALVAATPVARAQTAGEPAAVVVELYTSQGCFQCPRANRLLGAFSRERGVLALTFPVGIWDYLGWRDTFARPEFSERQRNYSRTLRVRGRYTPQLVVNGQTQTSASDWEEARSTVHQARENPRASDAPLASIARLRNGRVRVTLTGASRAPTADIWLVAYDPGPLEVAINGGLNIRRTISHYNLVRSIERLGAWSGEASWYERGNCNPECAVLVQTPDGGPILAAAATAATGRR
ncbi:MAG: DUF1223 domain-containing protein [Terricaulis sp.]